MPNDQPQPIWKVLRALPGSVVIFIRGTKTGARSYVKAAIMNQNPAILFGKPPRMVNLTDVADHTSCCEQGWKIS